MEYAHVRTVGDAGGRWSVVRATRFAGDGPVRVVVCHEDVTERHAAAEQLRHDSRHDALTGLPNRVLFAERVDRAVVAAGRTGSRVRRPVPRPGPVQDHQRRARPRRRRPPADRRRRPPPGGRRRAVDPAAVVTVARMGGDEFTLLVEHPAAAAGGRPRPPPGSPSRLLAAVARPDPVYDGQELNVTASIGIVVPSAPDRRRRGRDQANCSGTPTRPCTRPRPLGKARYVVFDQRHARRGRRADCTWRPSLRVALDRGEFRLDYQPIVSLATGAVAGFEALVRWFRDGSRSSAPADFIPVAEDTGLIVPLGEWVLRQACRQLAQWRASGPPLSGPVRDRQRLPPAAGRPGPGRPRSWQVLAETGLPASAVGLEITESADHVRPGRRPSIRSPGSSGRPGAGSPSTTSGPGTRRPPASAGSRSTC